MFIKKGTRDGSWVAEKMAKPSEEGRKCLLASYTADARWGRDGQMREFQNTEDKGQYRLFKIMVSCV